MTVSADLSQRHPDHHTIHPSTGARLDEMSVTTPDGDRVWFCGHIDTAAPTMNNDER